MSASDLTKYRQFENCRDFQYPVVLAKIPTQSQKSYIFVIAMTHRVSQAIEDKCVISLRYQC